MYIRPEQNYTLSDVMIDAILKDMAQPHCQIANMIPVGSTVLDIGAGSGTLGRVLNRAGKSVSIDGVEPNAFAVELAKPYYRTLYTGFAQDHYGSIKNKVYDYVVLADVIEHIPNPAIFLTELLDNLPESTKLIISIPNIAFGAARLALMNGFFDYVDSGLLERTHLRFFTLATAKKLFDSLNLSSERILFLERSFYRVEFDRSQLRASPFEVLNLASDPEARAYQYLFLLNRKQNQSTSTTHIGSGPIKILFDAIFARAWIKKIVLAQRKH